MHACFNMAIHLHVFLAALLLGPFTSAAQNDTQIFILHPNLLTQHRAESLCIEKGENWRLPIGNQHDSEKLKSYMEKNRVEYAWLAIRKKEFQEWKWVNGSKFSGTLKNIPGGLCAGVALQGMSLRSMVCGEKGNGFVCEMPAGALCPFQEHPQLCFNIGGNVFYIGCFTESWFHARSYCVQRGGDLAILDTVDKQHAVLNYVIDRKYITACGWLFAGLRMEDWYVQPNNEIPTDLGWGPDQPRAKHSCARTDNKGVWWAYPCDQPTNVVCQKYQNITEFDFNRNHFSKADISNKSQSLVVLVLLLAIVFVCLVIALSSAVYKYMQRRGKQSQETRVRKLGIDSSTANVLMFSSTKIKPAKSSIEIENVDWEGSNSQSNKSMPSIVPEIIQEGFKKFSNPKNLKIINIHFKDYNRKLADAYIVDILQLLLDYSGQLQTVILPTFEEELTDIKKVLLMLWDLREKVITITEATEVPSLPADEVLAVKGYIFSNKPSGNADFLVNDEDKCINSNSPAYVAGLAAAIKSKFAEEITGSRTKLLRCLFINTLIEYKRSMENGFGTIDIDSLANLEPKQVAKVKKSLARTAIFSTLPMPNTSMQVSLNQMLSTERNKIKIALLRPCPPPLDAALEKWNIQIRSRDVEYKERNKYVEYKERNKYQDEELHTITETLLLFKPDNIDITKYVQLFEMIWFHVCDEEWRHEEKAWQEFKEDIESCHVVYVTNIVHIDLPFLVNIQKHIFELSKKCVVVTLALSNGRKGAPTTIPADRVIAFGCRHKDKPNYPDESEGDDENFGTPERVPMIKSDATIGRFNDFSNGSTLDFLCGFDFISEDKKRKPANFQGVAVIAIVLAKAQFLVDSETMKRVCTTPVMHAILHQMSSHPEFHTIDEGWGELKPQPWLNDDDAFRTLLKHCAHQNNENKYWAGKNV